MHKGDARGSLSTAIPVSPKRWAFALGLGVAVLIAASTGATLLSLVDVRDPFLHEVRESVVRLAWVDSEANIPTWYSATLLLICSLLLAAIATVHRHDGLGFAGHWLILSLVFLYLSLDEAAQLHELSIPPIRSAFGATGLLYYGWIVPAGICLALLVLSYRRFLRSLPTRTRHLFLLAGAIFVGGAIGIEAVSGLHASVHGEENLIYHLIITVEELLEMSGVVLFIYALMDYMGHQIGRLCFDIDS
jgi:hypothetical protein